MFQEPSEKRQKLYFWIHLFCSVLLRASAVLDFIICSGLLSDTLYLLDFTSLTLSTRNLLLFQLLPINTGKHSSCCLLFVTWTLPVIGVNVSLMCFSLTFCYHLHLPLTATLISPFHSSNPRFSFVTLL